MGIQQRGFKAWGHTERQADLGDQLASPIMYSSDVQLI